MLKFSKKVEYGLMSIMHIARMKGNKVTARELSEQYNIPPEILGKVLQKLKKDQLLESIQGVNGGYRIIRELTDISLEDVIISLDGPVVITHCCKGTGDDCTQFKTCNIIEPMQKFQNKLNKIFSDMNLNDFFFDEEQKVEF